jgi:predicted ribosomally synthesized peptide with nif11-like leader
MALSAQDFISKVKGDSAFHSAVEQHIRSDLFRHLEKQGFHFTVQELHDALAKEPGVRALSDADAAKLASHGGGPVATSDLLSQLLYATDKYLKSPVQTQSKVIATGDPGSLRCAPFVAGDPGPAAMAKTRGKKAPWRASW